MSPGITRKSNQQTRMNGALLWFVELTDDYQDLRGLWRTWVVKFEIGEVWGIPLPVNNMSLGTSLNSAINAARDLDHVARRVFKLFLPNSSLFSTSDSQTTAGTRWNN